MWPFKKKAKLRKFFDVSVINKLEMWLEVDDISYHVTEIRDDGKAFKCDCGSMILIDDEARQIQIHRSCTNIEDLLKILGEYVE